MPKDALGIARRCRTKNSNDVIIKQKWNKLNMVNIGEDTPITNSRHLKDVG